MCTKAASRRTVNNTLREPRVPLSPRTAFVASLRRQLRRGPRRGPLSPPRKAPGRELDEARAGAGRALPPGRRAPGFTGRITGPDLPRNRPARRFAQLAVDSI